MSDLSNPMSPSHLMLRSEFYLTLARAFLTPQSTENFQAMVDHLANDLIDLDLSLSYGLTDEVTALRAALSEVSCHEELLIEYSRLFLQPPFEAPLNVCYAIDGAMMGGTACEIADFYRRYGVERGEYFKDFPDHLSMQLEFVALLLGRAAQALETGGSFNQEDQAANHFLHVFVCRWAKAFEVAVAVAGTRLELKANPYLPLARIITIAAQRDAKANPEWLQPKKQSAKAMDKARDAYANRQISADDMKDIERMLRERGLSTAHLDIAMGDRDPTLGLCSEPMPSTTQQ